MASTAAAAAARGPMALLLQNSSYQWVLLGTGVYLIAPDHVKESLHRGLLAATAASNGMMAPANHHHHPQQQQLYAQSQHQHPQQSHGPIVLRMDGGGRDSGNRSVVGTVVTVAVCMGGVWVTYAVITRILPDHLQQFLPVTKRALDTATEKLAGSLLKIKNVLGGEIKRMLERQNDLEDLQKDLGKGVQDLQKRVDSVGEDVLSMHATVDRCEIALETTKAMQDYTGRGVKLLVTAVQAMTNPKDQINKELQNYLRAGDLLFPAATTTTTSSKQVGPEDDRPQLTRSTSSSSTKQQQRRRLTPSIAEEEHQQLNDIRNNRLTDRIILTTTPAM